VVDPAGLEPTTHAV